MMNLVQSLQQQGVRLIAVTKNRPVDEIKSVLTQGIKDIGENRLQEAAAKLSDLPDGTTKHFIGRLQKNKVRDVVRLFDMIQSVDRLELAKKIEEECVKIGKTIPILVQVNTSAEPQKGGAKPDEALAFVRSVADLPHVTVQGLMTVAAEAEDSEKARTCFKTLKRLFDEIARVKIPRVQMRWLSMGMSDDYKIALEEGANMVRLGRALFEPV